MKQYKLQNETDPIHFERLVLPFLLKEEARYCLPIGLFSQLANDPARYKSFRIGAVLADNSICGVFWQTPPHPLGFSAMPKEALELIFNAFKTENITSFLGPVDEASFFLSLWTERTGKKPSGKIAQGIYQLTEVNWKPNLVGCDLRCVTSDDKNLLEEWNFAFSQDVHMPNTMSEATEYAERAIREKNRYFLILNGQPVCMAGLSGATPNGIRVNWVYTPPELRGKGYASQLVAEISQAMLNQGKHFCFLYTDLANPTSNKIYQRIGYKHVGDSVHYHLT